MAGFFYDAGSEATDAEIEEYLEGLDLRFPVTKPSSSSTDAAHWVRNPNEMLRSLTVSLNKVLDRCEARLYDGFQIQLKPEFITDRKNGVSPMLFDALHLTEVARIVELTNFIQPTPFATEIIPNLISQLYQGTSPEFNQAIDSYKHGLRRLADWIHTRQIIGGEVVPHTGENYDQTKPRSANYDDVKQACEELKQRGERPTKERIGKFLRDRHLTIGTTRVHRLKRQVEKQSAVRPSESTD